MRGPRANVTLPSTYSLTSGASDFGAALNQGDEQNCVGREGKTRGRNPQELRPLPGAKRGAFPARGSPCPSPTARFGAIFLRIRKVALKGARAALAPSQGVGQGVGQEVRGQGRVQLLAAAAGGSARRAGTG